MSLEDKVDQLEQLVLSLNGEVELLHKAIDYIENIPIFRFSLREGLETSEFIPKKAEPNATGFDVRACPYDKKDIIVKPNQYVKIPLGFRSYCPDEYWFQLVPRSSTFAKKSLHALYGTIDETFSGEIIFCAQYQPNSDQDLVIKYGEAIAQLIPYRRVDTKINIITNEEYNDLCKQRNAIRQSNGFGSTG